VQASLRPKAQAAAGLLACRKRASSSACAIEGGGVMGENSAISWCDHTFNIAWGCTKIEGSQACAHCYAEAWSKRVGLKVWGQDAPRREFGDEHWKAPLKWNARAAKAGRVEFVFCSSMADVFEDHPTIAKARERLWPIIEATPSLVWLLLTKRPQNMQAFAPASWEAAWPGNVWAGTTAETQAWADIRIATLRKVPAPVWFVSCEPMLGGIALPSDFLALGARAWVIAGGESGPHARPSHPAWFRSLRDQCAGADVPFHFKQHGEWAPYVDESKFTHGQAETASKMQTWMSPDGRSGGVWLYDGDGSWSNWSNDPPMDPDAAGVAILNRWGKKRAGRLLDGVEHNGRTAVTA
jgi:protein gp37